MILRQEQTMRKTILTLVASAALAFGIAGQASARDDRGGGNHGGGYQGGGNHGGGYHGGGNYGGGNYGGGYHDRDRGRHYDRGHYRHQSHGRHYRHHNNHYRPYYTGYYDSPYAYGPPAPYYGGYGYGVGYSQPGFGIYFGR